LNKFYSLLFGIFFSTTLLAQQPDVVTVMTYNLLNYRNATSYCTFTQNNPLTKEQHLKTIVQYVQPDILVCNELGDAPTNADFILLNSLNVSGVNYYVKAPYSNNSFSSLVNAFFYDSRKFELHSQEVITKDLSNNNLVRVIDLYRLYYKDSLLTNQSDTVFFTVVAAHLKAGTAAADASDRADAAAALMQFIQNYVNDENVLMCGDLNIYKSQEAAYQNLTQGSNVGIRFYDPLNQPGNWGNNGSFAQLHTQSTRNTSTNNGCFSSGGLDDRLDHILITDEVRDNLDGMRYVPNTYHALGNDGLHFNKAITDDTNNSVPATVLNAIYGLSDHLPVIAEFEIKRQQIGVDENSLFAAQVKFANPVNIFLELTLNSANAKNPRLRIISLTGAEMHRGNMVKNAGNYSYNCDVSAFAKGLYFIEITTANGLKSVKKMVKL